MATFFTGNNTITNGTINDTVIGNLIPSTAVFTSLSASATGVNAINLETTSGLLSLDSTSGNMEFGTGTSGTLDIGSSGSGVVDITSGSDLNLQSNGIMNLTTVTGDIDLDSTSGNILLGIDTTGNISVGSTSANDISIVGSSLTSDATSINIGTGITTTSVNIGTGSNIDSNGVVIGRSGITTTISGNLDVLGNLNTINESNLSIENNHITLNANYDSETPLTGTIEVITNPETAATQTLIATGGFTSTTTVNVVDATPLGVGDIIVITGANESENNNLFAVQSINTGVSPHEITIKTTSNVGTMNNSFVVDSTVSGRVTRTSINHLRSTTTGTWQIGYGNNDNTFTFSRITGSITDERLVFSNGISNNITPNINISNFACIHNSGTISGVMGSGPSNGFSKTIVCNSFPFGDELAGVRYELTVQPYQAGRGEILKNRVFRFTSAGQSVNLMWVVIPKTTTISCVRQSDFNDDEYIDMFTADNVAEYRFWFNVSGGATGPDAGGKILVEVDISVLTTSYEVATALAAAITSTGNFTAATNEDNSAVVQAITNAYTSTSTSDTTEAVLDADFAVENYEGTWINSNAGIDLI